MTRRIFLLSTLLSPLLLVAKQWHLGRYGAFSFQNVHANIFIMHGVISAPDAINKSFINNPAFIESKNGLILVDPGGSSEIAKHVHQQIQAISSKPVIAIFNTHDHDDHWFGNAYFKERYPDVDIYAHTKMPEAAVELYGGRYKARGFSFEDEDNVIFPNILLKGEEYLQIDSESFYIQHPEAAHTNNDIAITHLNSNTIFMGDLLMSKTLANFGLHSSIHGNIRFLEKIVKEKAFDLYVAGHGPSGSKEAVLMPYYTYLSIIEEEVQQALNDDFTMTELDSVKERILERLSWQEHLEFSHAFVARYMIHLYSELSEKDF